MSDEVNTPGSSSLEPAASADPRLYLRDAELDRGVMLILAGERALSAAAETTRQSAALSRSEMQVLMAIRYQPGLNVGQLRERLAATVPTLARILGTLDERSLIQRPRAGQDRRQRSLTLSPEGIALTEPLASAMRERLKQAYREAGPDQVSGARRLLEALSR
jgi:DNA-binding MarR family transcriptional regulator